MVNFGYGPGMKGWNDEKAPLLAQRLRALLVTMEKQRKFDNIREHVRPYVETDGLYEGVRIRKITHLLDEVEDELIAEAEKIYYDVMSADEPKRLQIMIPGLPWRRVDSMLASSCIQRIQKDPEVILDIMSGIGITDEGNAAEAFNAWRVGLLERMEQEYDKNERTKELKYSPGLELLEDIKHYNKLVDESHR
jgi:hypothetical protein